MIHPRVAVVDTGSGNLRSVEKALAAAGADVHITGDPQAVAAADKIVVPGQGAFGGCVAGLSREGGALRDAVLAAIKKGTPYYGICLGLQVLFEGSEEDPTCRGLGVIPGRVVRFPAATTTARGLKVPHMGWNQLSIRRPAPVLRDLADGSSVYFVHSYYVAPKDPSIIATQTDYPTPFTSAIWHENVFATQFHPEKSQQVGLEMLRRFAEWK